MQEKEDYSRHLTNKLLDAIWPQILCILERYRKGSQMSITIATKAKIIRQETIFGHNPRNLPTHQYASDKVRVSQRLGMTSGRALHKFPHKLLKGEIQRQGSYIHCGIIVGISGLRSDIDEGIAQQVCALIITEIRCRHKTLFIAPPEEFYKT